MSRSFRDLVEALKAKEEKSELKPRAKGEEDFAADQGYPPKIGGPNDRPYPEKGSDDVVNARKMTKTKMHDNPVPGNETDKQPMQGSSKAPELKTYREIIAGLKQTDGGRGYQLDNGDKKIVRTSPSAVHGVDLDEAVHDQLVTIAETSKPAMVRFQNGETATVNPQTAHKMLETVSRLNASNARRFNESINKSPADFLKMMQFSEKH